MYTPPSGNIQVSSLIKSGNIRWVCNIFDKCLHKYISSQKVAEVLSKIGLLKDCDIYKYFNNIIDKEQNGSSSSKGKSEKRSFNRARDVKNILSQAMSNFSELKYLDIGSGDCSIPVSISEVLQIPLKNVYCTDVDNWYEKFNIEKKSEINFEVLVDGKNTSFKNEVFDFVTCFQSLHHVEKIDSRLSDISRITRRGGYFLIREHDCFSDEIRMLIDIEHCIYETVLGEYRESFIKEYMGFYKNKYEWTSLLRKYGFVYVRNINYNISYGKYNPTKFYYGLYKKI